MPSHTISKKSHIIEMLQISLLGVSLLGISLLYALLLRAYICISLTFCYFRYLYETMSSLNDRLQANPFTVWSLGGDCDPVQTL